MAKRKDGFTLIEIMIVVGVILILAVIAIPNMVRSKMVGNETSAISVLKAVTNASNLYTLNKNDYPADIKSLMNETPPYINEDLAKSFQGYVTPVVPKDGYTFTYSNSAGEEPGFVVTAAPYKFGVTGIRTFYCNEKSIIKYCDSAGCSPSGGQEL